jgi:hypothetical protein
VAYLLPLAVLTTAPSEARAGCEHGVTSAKGGSLRFSVSRLEALAAAGAVDGEASHDSSRRKLPCSGPNCREGRPSPDVPVLSPPVKSDSWCEPPAVRLETGADTDRLGAASGAIHPRHQTFPLERPPRITPPLALS